MLLASVRAYGGRPFVFVNYFYHGGNPTAKFPAGRSESRSPGSGESRSPGRSESRSPSKSRIFVNPKRKLNVN